MSSTNRNSREGVQQIFEDLGSQHGFVTTSTTRSADENKRVGGVPNSQHLDTIGTARDWSVKGKTQQEINDFANALRAQGFQVITKPHGTGPHVHAELPPGGLPATAGQAPVATTPAPPKPASSDWRQNLASSRSDAEAIADRTVDRMIGLESGGKANAVNQASGAAGVGQFVAGTWVDMLRKYAPAEAEGLSEDQILAKRFDPVLNRRMTQEYARENARYLQAQGLPVNEDTIYLAHHFGAGGAAKIIRAPDATPMRNLISQSAYDQNPYLQNLTVGGLVSTHRQRAGGSSRQERGPGFSAAESQSLSNIDQSAQVRLDASQAAGMVKSDRFEREQKAIQDYTANMKPVGQGLYDAANAVPGKSQVIDQIGAEQRAEQAKDDNTTFGDKFDAARNDTLIFDALRWYDRQGMHADPNWTAKAAEAELAKQGRAWAPDDFNHLVNETVSRDDFYTQMSQVQIREEDQETLSRGSMVTTLAAGGAAALMDPTTYVFGVGGEVAAARVLGVGLKASVVGGAVGEVAYVGSQQALGRYNTTATDYLMAGAFGAVLNGGSDLLTGRSARNAFMRDVDTATRELQEAANRSIELKQVYVDRARRELGPEATDADIQVKLDQYQGEDIADKARILLSEVPEEQMVMKPNSDSLYQYIDAVDTGVDRKTAREGLSDSVNLVTDDKKAAVLNDIIQQSQRTVDAAGPIDARRVEKAGYLGPLASAGTKLLKSDNPVAKAIGVRLTENAVGAVRNRTAAVVKYSLERIYLGNAENVYENGFRAWMKRNNRANVRSFFEAKHRAEFEDMLFNHVENIRMGIENTGPNADILENVYGAFHRSFDVMRVHQQRIGTRGSDILPNTSRGYMPYLVDPEKLRVMSMPDRSAYVQAMANDIYQRTRGLGDEALTADQADGIARSWMETMWTKANSNQHIASSGWSRRGGEEIETAIKAMDVSEAEKQSMLNAIKKGQASHLKNRVERNMNTEFKGENGRTIRLSDIMVKDPITLLRRQAGRVSGEVSLKMWGIDGKAGFDQLKEAAIQGANPASRDALDAIDQVAAEFLGLPYGNQTPALASNLMAATRISRLGGLVFAQAMETANMVHGLGVVRTAKVVPEFRRLLTEVKALAKGEIVPESFLKDFESIAGTVGTDNYRMQLPAESISQYVPAWNANDADKLGRALRTVENAQNRLTLQHAVMSVQQRHATEQIIHKAAQYIRDGVEDKALADMGFKPDMIARLKADIGNWAKFDPKGRLQQFTPNKATDPEAMSEMIQAVLRGSKQIIQESFVGERSKWVHNWGFKFMTQFRTYPIQATEKQLIRQGYTFGAARAMGYMIGSMSVIVPIQVARALIYSAGMDQEKREEYIEKMLDPKRLAYNSMGYLSQLGILSEVLDMGAGFAGLEVARTDVGKQSGVVSQIVPGVGYAEDLIRGMHDAAKKGDASKLVGLIPGMRSWQLVPFYNALKDNLKPSDEE